MKKILEVVGFIIVVFICILFIYFEEDNVNDKYRVSLDKCIDGDTASFILNNKKVKVRFIGIDTPEIEHDDIKAEEYGNEALDFTCNKLKNANDIELEFDIDKYDKYNRMLAWVYVDGVNLNKLLVSNGYARVYYVYNDYKYIDDLCREEDRVYNSKINIWQKENKSYCRK